jgi:hypothetical protein
MKPMIRSAALMVLATNFFLLLTLEVVRADYAATVLSNSPLAYFRFNESVATPPLNTVTNFGLLGSTANGYAVNGAAKGEAGIVGSSVRFTNPGTAIEFSGAKIDVPHQPALNTAPPFSIEFWARPNSLGTNDPGLCPLSSFDPNWYGGANRSGWLFYVNNNGGWYFRLGNTAGTAVNLVATNGNASAGVWQHIVATCSSTNANLYANGVLIGSAVIPAVSYVPNAQSFLRIGGTPLSGSGAFATAISASSNLGNRGYDGWVDEVAIYTNVLSPAAIAEHYTAGTTAPGSYPAQVLANSPVGYWNLNEPAVATPSVSSLPSVTNSGSLGSTANATNQWGALPAQSGPGYTGFGAGNRATFFDGHNGYVQINDAPGLHFSSNVTMMAWIKPTEKDFFRNIIAHGMNQNRLETFLRISRGAGAGGYGDNNYYEVGSGGGAPYVSAYYPMPPGDLGNWVFLAGTWDGTNWNLFRNGVLIKSEFANNGAYDVTNRWVIGSRSDPQPGQGQYFGGWIDEPAIFNTALSPAAIAAIYNAAQVPPVITRGPQVTNTVFAGSSVTLSVWAEGSPNLSYRWLSNGIFTGVLATNITFNNLSAGNKTIAVVVTNNYGAITSSVSFVVAASAPSILQQPQSIARFVGFPFSLSVTAGGSAPLTYYWKLGGVVVQSGASSTYSGTASLGTAGTYTCVVSNSLGTITTSNAVLTVSALPENYSGQVIASSPIGYWRLGETSGSVANDFIAGNNGTYFNATLNQAGYSLTDANKAVAVSGVNSYVGNISGSAINFTGETNFTLEVWVKGSPSQNNEATIIAKGIGNNGITRTEQFALDVAGGFYRFFTAGDGTIYAAEANAGPNGAWQHIVAVYDHLNTLGGGQKSYLYVNGELKGTGNTRFSGLNATTSPVSFGSKRLGFSPNYDGTFNGTIDEVAIYATALDASTVQAHYLATYGANTPPFITVQPAAVTNYAGLPATLQVSAAGTEPLSYQWKKNGADIGGANDRIYTIPNLDYPDAANYSVQINNGVGETNSAAVALTVLPPPATPPAIAGLVLHLPFDGNLTDATGRGNHGVAIHKTSSSSNIVAATFVSDAPLGQGVHYETQAINTGGQTSIATDAQYVTLGVRPDLQFSSGVDFSIAYWIRIPLNFFGGDLPFFTDAVGSVGNDGFVFAPAYGYGTADPNPIITPEHYGGWAMSVFGGGVGVRYYGDLGSINDGNWFHLAHTVDRESGNIVTYLNGIVASTTKMDGTSIRDSGSIVTGRPATIGQDPTGNYGETGAGDMDDLGVWKKVLTPLEVAAIYTAARSNQLSFVNLPVSISVQNLGGNQIQLTWPTGTLQAADNAAGPYTDLPAATSPYAVSVGAPQKFYRIKL